MTDKPDQFPKKVFDRSVQEYPDPDDAVGNLSTTFTWDISTFASGIPQWGDNPIVRDIELRKFWKKESILSGAVYGTSVRNAALEWEIEGPPRTAEVVTNMLKNAIAGPNRGWIPFCEQVSEDLYTQDNGAFIEIIRTGNKPTSPVIGIAHLDSGQCVRTGDPEFPVIYTDKNEVPHKMPWYKIIPWAEYPSPVEEMNGIGFCAVSRIFQMATLMKDIAVFKIEKVGGRHYKQMHLVSGVGKKEIKDTLARGQEDASNSGQTRFIMPAILASLDPTRPVTTATVDLASLPDNFDLDTELKWYIAGLALAFGADYQEFAPLPSGNLGSGSQSEMLHRKSRGKGSALFMESFQDIMRLNGVIPSNVRFVFKAKDMLEMVEEQEMNKTMAETLAILVRSNIINAEAARAALAKGVIDEDVVKIVPTDFGNEEFGASNQLLGTAGGQTIGDDAGRTQKGLLDRILRRA